MTREQAAELWPVVKAYSEGMKVQFRDVDNEWQDCNESEGDPQWRPGTTYRIKPEPKFVPWTMEDVPPVCWVRMKGNPNRHSLVTDLFKDSVQFCDMQPSFCALLDRYEYSTDLMTWKPCGKEA